MKPERRAASQKRSDNYCMLASRFAVYLCALQLAPWPLTGTVQAGQGSHWPLRCRGPQKTAECDTVRHHFPSSLHFKSTSLLAQVSGEISQLEEAMEESVRVGIELVDAAQIPV